MDLSIPGEKNMYLKAASSQERQLWLVALGSSKACFTNNNRKESGKLKEILLNFKS
jgi:pleckstrin family protein A (phosphoinositide binding specific) protein 8